ncbi:hypothetical protein HY498_00810 [Candidatus Woesearchaeota archaeon]|nr:hypothetical protein [Candidatus Woesearchaeota archaeon]
MVFLNYSQNFVPLIIFVISFVILTKIDSMIVFLAHSYIISNKKFKYFEEQPFRYIFFSLKLFLGKFTFDEKLKYYTLIHRILFILHIVLIIIFIIGFFWIFRRGL